MILLFYGNCQVRAIKRIIEYITEPANYSLILFRDIDQITENEVVISKSIALIADAVICTKVTDFKTPDYHSEALFSNASCPCIEIPSLYFSGLAPNVGELKYPNGTKGYEDIWIYNFLALNREKISDEGWLNSIKTSLANLVYEYDGDFNKHPYHSLLKESFDLGLSESFSRLHVDQRVIYNKIGDQVITLSPAEFILKNMNLIHKLFYSTNHPNPNLLLDISLNISKVLGLSVFNERVKRLQNGQFDLIDLSSIDFIQFNLPAVYKKYLGLSDKNDSFIDYRNRYSIANHNKVSLESYIDQLADRMTDDLEIVFDNLNYLEKYKDQKRILDLSVFISN